MRIVVTSVFVEDQEKALSFYTNVLEFQKQEDVPLGEDRWLTVVSPEDPEGVELLLEPSGHPAIKPFKRALVEDGIPFTSFGIKDIDAEHARLEDLGVKFTQPPTKFGDVTTDTPTAPHTSDIGASQSRMSLDASEFSGRL